MNRPDSSDRSQPALKIQPARRDDCADALRLLCQAMPDDQRAEQYEFLNSSLDEGLIPLEGLLVAVRGGRLVGAILGCLHAGRIAAVYAPHSVPEERFATNVQLHDALIAVMTDCVLLQAALPLHDHVSLATLCRLDYQPLAELIYLIGTRETARPQSTEPIELQRYDDGDWQRLAAVVERTYIHSLDCPALDGLRKIDDVLTGYRQSALRSDSMWFFCRHQGKDVGCLLLADHPAQQQWELVYMGLLPEVRGRGWGRAVVSHALQLLAQSSRQQLVLAVDALNGPALHMYHQVGFNSWTRRRVLVRQLAATPPRQGFTSGGNTLGSAYSPG